MDKRENLPAKLAAQGLAATIEKRGSLVARGMAAILTNSQPALSKDEDAIYRQAREVWNRITDDGNKFGVGDIYSENEFAELKTACNTFRFLAEARFERAYFPLAIIFSVGIPSCSDDGGPIIQIDNKQAQHYAQLAFNWFRDKLFSENTAFDPEICNDLGVLYMAGEYIGGAYYLGCASNNKPYQPDYTLAFRCFKDAADEKNPAAMFNLSGMYESGCGVKQDWEKSLYWQIKAAKAGHKKAQQGLEQQHEHGDLETKIDDEQVLDWYVWSAEQGRLWAQLFLAYAFHCGDLIEQDDEQAAHWYLQAATQGEPHAQLQLGKMYWEGRGVEQDYEQAEYWLENSADQGSAESQYQFGQFLCEKGGEEEVAAQLIQCAADQEYGPAQYVIASDIGIFDVSDEQCAELLDKALAWYEEEAKFDSELRLDLALIHLDSWHAPYNKSHRANRFDGLRLLEEVASEPLVIDSDNRELSSKNDAQRRASRRLGIELLKHPNADEVLAAIRWLSQAVDLGDAVACVDLAEMYLCGHRGGLNSREPQPKLVEIDLHAAVYWFERGFQLGWSTAAYKLGCEYLYGKHLPQNQELAEKWLLQAANAGNLSAPSVLGEEYASGVRFRQDSEVAIYWLSLAAAHSQRACLKLASIYLDGKITPRNFDEAIKWLTLAADGGFRNQAMKLVSEKCAGGQFSAAEVFATQAWLVEMAAQAYETVSDEKYPARDAHNAYHLGELYELGLGVEQSMGMAIHWYRQSAEQDLFVAKKRLDELGIDWKNT